MSLRYVGYSGLNLSELSQLNLTRISYGREAEGRDASDPGLVCTKSLKLKFGEIFNI